MPDIERLAAEGQRVSWRIVGLPGTVLPLVLVIGICAVVLVVGYPLT